MFFRQYVNRVKDFYFADKVIVRKSLLCASISLQTGCCESLVLFEQMKFKTS